MPGVLEDLRAEFGLTWTRLASLLGVDVGTLHRWRKTGSIPESTHASVSGGRRRHVRPRQSLQRLQALLRSDPHWLLADDDAIRAAAHPALPPLAASGTALALPDRVPVPVPVPVPVRVPVPASFLRPDLHPVPAGSPVGRSYRLAREPARGIVICSGVEFWRLHCIGHPHHGRLLTGPPVLPPFAAVYCCFPSGAERESRWLYEWVDGEFVRSRPVAKGWNA
jgi:hypothetical protein